MKIKRRDGAVVDVADNHVLSDGETMTVEMRMMDSMRGTIHDGSGRPVGQRPGFLVSDSDTELAVRETIYREYANAISGRWQSNRWQGGPAKPAPTPTFDGSPAARDASYEQYRNDISNRWRR